jgi:hypothetical protein
MLCLSSYDDLSNSYDGKKQALTSSLDKKHKFCRDDLQDLPYGSCAMFAFAAFFQ